jgi:hypothetical protein
MTAIQFWDFQEAIVYIFGQFIYWFAAFLVAGGILAAVAYAFLNLFAWLSRRRS